MIDNLPIPAIRRILNFLRFAEVKNLSEAFPNSVEIQGLCELEIKIMMGREIENRKYLNWNRCAYDDLDDIMAARGIHSLAYFPPNRSIYCFGGENRQTQGRIQDRLNASLNDLWRLDLATLRWSRVNVPIAPYPSAKFGASFVVWKDEIVLYGGLCWTRDQTIMSPHISESECHIFNPQKGVWRAIATEVQGPEVNGHAALIENDRMMIFGGRAGRGQLMDSQHLHILDLVKEIWTTIDLCPTIFSEITRVIRRPNGFPMMDLDKTTLIGLGKNKYLITGEMDMDYGEAILLSETEDGWKWKRIETNGRWWNDRIIEQNGERIRNLRCNLPNVLYYSIAVIRNEAENKLRLVSLGKAKNEKEFLRKPNNILEMYDKIQQRSQTFVQVIQTEIEKEMENRKDSETSCCEHFELEFEGTWCRIENCFLMKNEQEKYLPMRNRIFLKCENVEKWEGLMFDDVDLWEMRMKLKSLVTQLHAKHYNIKIDKPFCAHLPMRNRSMKRFTIYVAELDLNQEIEKIEWIAQPMQYRASPETNCYRLISAENEIIMHGGYFHYNETMSRMGHTHILTLVKNVPQPEFTAPRIFGI